MGLAGRKQKQRIPADPRNLTWADDGSRFGLSYLSKFGWDASKGLGSSGDGMKTHLKVQQKLDMMGIGAQHQRDPNGIAWKQNKDFEALLKRLNGSAEQGKGPSGEGVEGAVSVRETALDSAFMLAHEEKEDDQLEDESSVIARKRKHEDVDLGKNTRKKQKEMKKKRQKSTSNNSATSVTEPTSEPSSELSPSNPRPEPIPKTRPLAHRARIRATKRIADKSVSAIAEILGIAPSSSVSPLTSTPAPTPPSSSIPEPSLSLDNLTTSTKSVADYFKEKLLARSSSSSSPSSSSAPSESATPGLGAPGSGLSGSFSPDDEDALPRRGIGSRFPVVPPSSQVPETTSAAANSDVDARNTLTEKQRQKAERKAKKEKRRRQEVETRQAAPECASTATEEQVNEDDVGMDQRTLKERKQKKRRKRGEQTC